jgi:hypothetical protein
LQIDLGADTALRLSYRRNRYDAFDDTDWSGRVQWYF